MHPHSAILQTVDIQAIKFSNSWSLHPFLGSNPPQALLNSIQRIGILHPPILLSSGLNTFQILSGYFRLLASKLIAPSNSHAPCLVLEKNTPLQHILSLVLEDQLLSGKLSPIEKAYFLKHCSNYSDFDELSDSFHKVLGNKAQPHTIKKLNNLLKLETTIQVTVHEGRINEKMAHALLSLPSDDRLFLHDIILELDLGGGKQKRLLSLSQDIACREGNSIKNLLTTPRYQEILQHKEMNKPQKIGNLLTTLHKELLPQSNSAEESFFRRVQQMNIPAGCNITHSQSFEKDDVSLTLTFPNLDSMESKITAIKKILE